MLIKSCYIFLQGTASNLFLELKIKVYNKKAESRTRIFVQNIKKILPISVDGQG